VSVDINRELFQSVVRFYRDKQAVDGYTTQALTDASGKDKDRAAADIKAKISDYSRYRVVVDTSRHFEQFSNWIDQFVYLRWKQLIETEAGAIASATITHPQGSSEREAAVANLTRELVTKAVAMEGKFLVISVHRATLFKVIVSLCVLYQSDIVDLNTVHLTLTPHTPMDVTKRDASKSQLADMETLRPRLSVQLLVTYIHVNCTDGFSRPATPSSSSSSS
jgi:hypothetical protein